jgi:hypothetical protein
VTYTQLIYVSDLRDKNTGEGELVSIVESAVRHNTEDNITGMLLYSGGNFLQVLEGNKELVHKTYDRIHLDPRHKNIILLTEEEVEERHFMNWSMGYRRLGKDDVAKFPIYAPLFQFGFKANDINAKSGVALEMLKLFSKQMT